MFASRLHCHFCGTRSNYPKNVQEFRCTNCEALNFFDGKGNVIDTPTTVASQPVRPFSASQQHSAGTAPLPKTFEHQQQPVFCRKCVQNQLLYTQALANYLPDDDHPQYRQIEAAFPQYKADLEKRYPQICKQCAPLAQANINRADYYSKTQLISKLASTKRAQRGRPTSRPRDDKKKKLTRFALRVVGLLSSMSLLAQVAFHVYGILVHMGMTANNTNADNADFSTNRSIRFCLTQASLMRFDDACLESFGTFIPQTIILAAALLWYNPGLKAWYHHTIRIEAVQGQWDYLGIQILILLIRCVAWYNLSDSATTAQFDSKRMLAFHLSAIVLPCTFQLIAQRTLRPVAWKMKGNIMPRPQDRDVLGAFAGPEQTQHTPKASEKDPWRHLRKQDKSTFDINGLAPQSTELHSRLGFPRAEDQFPSPEDTEESDEEGDDGDAMETDFQPVMRSSFTSQPQHAGTQLRARKHHIIPQEPDWSNMRGAIFGMQDQMREDEQRRSQQQQQQRQAHDGSRSLTQPSPFRGKLPPAPMSMERRLRNPVAEPAIVPTVPLSQRQDFFAQMASGIRPVAFPEKGSSLELRQSKWTLPSDVRETGLEDLMSGSSFRIHDEPSVSPVKKTFDWFSSLLGRNG